MLNGKALPWVNELNHLGNALQSNNSMDIDCDNKRFNFIRKISSLNQEFHFSSGDVKMKIFNIYAMSLYGSCLWDLFSHKCERLYKAWNVCVRISFNLSRYTHRDLIEPVSNVLHPKVILSSRYIGFHQTLTGKCNKAAVKMMSNLNRNDLRTSYGKNLNNISKACNIQISELSPRRVKESMKYKELSNEDKWKLNIINDLLLAREGHIFIPNFDNAELNFMLDFVCSS